MKKVIYTVIFLSLVFAESSGQTMKELFDKVSKNYLAVDPFSADVDVYLFKNKNDTKGSLLGTGLLRKSGRNYYSKFLDDELICNEQCTIILDHYYKRVSYFDEPKTLTRKPSYDIPDVDSMLKLNDSIVYKGVEEGCKVYSFYTHQGPVVCTQVSVDTAAFFVRKLVYYYSQENTTESYDAYKIIINYKNLSLKKINDNVFSAKQYVVRKNGQLQLTPAFSNYKLTVAQNEKNAKKSF